MSTKKIIIGIIILIALIAVYAVGLKRQESTSPEAEAPTQDEGQSAVIDTLSSDISRIVIERKNDTLELINVTEEGSDDTLWRTADVDENSLNQDNVGVIAYSAATLYSSQKIESEDLGEYGLENPDTVVHSYYKDGTEKTIKLGSQSIDGNYYYALIEGDSNIYMVDSLDYRRFNYTLNDIIKKDIASIAPAQIIYVDIKYNDKDEVEIEYEEEKEGSAQELAQFGMQTLTMKKPLEGAAVYPNNLQSYVLTKLTSLALSDLADENPDDYSKYGLEEPVMDITLKDTSNSLRLRVGNETDEGGYSYCTVDDRKEVFTIENSLIESFRDVDVLKITERFVSLVYRVDVESISLKNGEKSYDITFVQEGDTEPATNDDGTKNLKDTRTGYINGKKCDDEEFSSIYQLITGLTFDSIEQTEISQMPEVSIVYNMLDKTKKEINFYNYNDNFYSAELDGQDLSRLVNKQSVKAVFKALEEY